MSTEAFNLVEACITCYNIISTEADDRVEACDTCYNKISIEAYNRAEACNTCYNLYQQKLITELKHVSLVIM